MTLEEVKRAIENIEKQLTSINIPVKFDGIEAKLIFFLASDNEGKLFANLEIYQNGGGRKSRATLRKRITNLEVGEEINIPLTEFKVGAVQTATCILGREKGRRYTTKADMDNNVIRVTRVK